MTSDFFKSMSQGIENQMQKETNNNLKQHQQLDADKTRIQMLVDQAEKIQQSVSIQVPQLHSKDISIDKKMLNKEMESAMVLHSNIIDDIFKLKNLVEQMKVLLNSAVGILHHNLKFKNQYKLKTTKELDTYIAREPSYNIINVRIREIQNLIDRSMEYSGLIKQKIGFIRDLTKMRTQEMFSEK